MMRCTDFSSSSVESMVKLLLRLLFIWFWMISHFSIFVRLRIAGRNSSFSIMSSSVCSKSSLNLFMSSGGSLYFIRMFTISTI